jgi:hypothetical protein
MFSTLTRRNKQSTIRGGARFGKKKTTKKKRLQCASSSCPSLFFFCFLHFGLFHKIIDLRPTSRRRQLCQLSRNALMQLRLHLNTPVRKEKERRLIKHKERRQHETLHKRLRERSSASFDKLVREQLRSPTDHMDQPTQSWRMRYDGEPTGARGSGFALGPVLRGRAADRFSAATM